MAQFARRSLFRKYAVWLSGLVVVLLVLSGVIGGYFSYRQSIEAVEQLQREKARFIAAGIDDFIGEVERGLRLAGNKFASARSVETEDLALELVALLRHRPELIELHWVDADGEERLSLSRLAKDETDGARNWLNDPCYIATRTARGCASRVYLRDAEPYVSLAVTRAPGAQMLVGDANLKFVSDFIAAIPMNSSDVVYVVDGEGRLISHVDPRRALRREDLRELPQVKRALAGEVGASAATARNLEGARVVSTSARIERLGWTVLAEQDEAEAFKPVYAAVGRSVLLVAIGVLAAVLASLALAKRMADPIRRVAAGAKAIGRGQLDERIDIASGDEIESLADEFNDMAERLQATHSMQEARIEERTQALALANQAKSRFLACASHDLRQPLHALALFVGQLREAKRSETSVLVAKIEHSVDALAHLFEGLLDLSKLDMGGMRPEFADVPLQDLLSRLTSHLAPIAEAKGLALTMVPSSLWVRSDALLLERAMLNLLSNAIQYTHEGRVLVGARRHAGSVDLVIADSGIGIADVHLSSIFEEFYRIDPTASTTRNFGLGLAIVKRLVALLGHTIEVRSVLGRGTMVRVRVGRAFPQARAVAAAAPDTRDLNGLRVLIIDDDDAVRDGIAGLLRQWGCHVVAASGGQEALERMSSQTEAVLCDLRLANGESGLDVVDRLRACFGGRLACAFITGETDSDSIASIRAHGFPVGFKPMPPAKLRALVEYLASMRV